MNSEKDLLHQPHPIQPKPPNSFKSLKQLILLTVVLLSALVGVAMGHFLGIRNTQFIHPSQPSSIPQPTMINQISETIVQPPNNQPTAIPITPTLHQIHEVIEVSPMVAPTTDPSLTASWKVYTNEEIGISFKYPPLFGSINNNEELCWSDVGLMRNYQNQPCVGIELESATVNGKMTFLVAQSKLFLEHRLGRGAYWGDLSAVLSKNAEISVKGYCTNYNLLRIACSVSVNSNGVMYAKSIETVQKRGEPEYDEKAIYYVILNKNRDFPVIIISSSENDILSFKESERIFDQLLSILKFTS